ncbi:MAG: glycerol kinase GlpK [Sphingobium sp.]
MNHKSIIAIDQGTTSTRAIRFGADGAVLATAAQELPQYYPQPGWVEQDPEDIWAGTLHCLLGVMDDDAVAIGITNQRETIILWDRETGRPLANAIVWQDRRTAGLCTAMRDDGLEPVIRKKTGLLLDPYFSATKLRWLLDHVEGARQRALQGKLAAGTVDSFLLWRLTGGRVHATDVTNASRTMLYDIHRQCWDNDLLAMFDIPESILPVVYDNVHIFGETDAALTGRSLPISGMAGDQQAALIGQRCFAPGMIKSTYGTGCFLLANTGAKPVLSSNRLLTSPAYRFGGEAAYALEGSIFVAGAAVKWLRDTLGLIASAEDTARLAASVPDNHGVHLVPAFVGLGAPHWRDDAKAAITGMTLDTGPAHFARAALEAAAFQTGDLLDAMMADGVSAPSLIRVDGGMATNDWFVQFLVDQIGIPVERPAHHETTAFGAAMLAGMGVGLWGRDGPTEVARDPGRFHPAIDATQRADRQRAWQAAVRLVLAKEQG